MIAIKSRQRCSVKGAVRVVQFSMKKSLDLLLYTEHTSNFTILDTRTLEKQQSFSIDDSNGERQITGAVFSFGCESLYVGSHDKLIKYDVDLYGRRMFSQYSIL